MTMIFPVIIVVSGITKKTANRITNTKDPVLCFCRTGSFLFAHFTDVQSIIIICNGVLQKAAKQKCLAADFQVFFFPEQSDRDVGHGPIRFRWDNGESEKGAVFLIKPVRYAVKSSI